MLDDKGSAQMTAVTVPLIVISRLGLVITGSFLLFTAITISTFAGNANHVMLVASLLVYLYAFGLLLLAATKIEFKWADFLILVGVLAGLLCTYYLVFSQNPRNYVVDNLAFAHTSAELVVRGQNPYSVRNRDVLIESGKKAGLAFYTITKQPDGQIVDRLFVYPGGLLLAYVGPVALGLKDMRWVPAIATLMTLVVLWWQAPPVLRPLACLPVLVSFEHSFLAAIAGTADSLWLLPLMFCVIALNKQRLDLAALAFGIAIAIKQQPMLLIPFIAVWLWLEARELSTGVRASVVARFFAIAVALFVVFNLPFMIWNFADWFSAMIWELTAKQVVDGTGLSALSSSGILHFSRDVYTLLSAIVFVVLFLCYVKFFATLKHAVWIFPGIVFWFAFRSFENYFIYWVPLLVLSIFTMWRDEQARATELGAAGSEPSEAIVPAGA